MSLVLIRSVRNFFLGSDSHDHQDVPLLHFRQMLRQYVVNQILALHAVHATEPLRGDDPDDPVVVTELHLVRRWEAFFQDLLEFPSYCHWKISFLARVRWD